MEIEILSNHLFSSLHHCLHLTKIIIRISYRELETHRNSIQPNRLQPPQVPQLPTQLFRHVDERLLSTHICRIHRNQTAECKGLQITAYPLTTVPILVVIALHQGLKAISQPKIPRDRSNHQRHQTWTVLQEHGWVQWQCIGLYRSSAYFDNSNSCQGRTRELDQGRDDSVSHVRVDGNVYSLQSDVALDQAKHLHIVQLDLGHLKVNEERAGGDKSIYEWPAEVSRDQAKSQLLQPRATVL